MRRDSVGAESQSAPDWTRSVFERYNIVSDGDLIEAARKLDAAVVGTFSGTLSGSGLAIASSGSC